MLSPHLTLWVPGLSEYYLPSEIMGARIYDSIGLYYGLFDGIRVERDMVYLVAVIVAEARERVVDVDRLKAMLVDRGYSVGGLTVEVLVNMARGEGLDIPYRIAESRVKLLKGLIPSSEVAAVGRRSVMGGDLTVILLNTPREARYRGLSEAPVKDRFPPEEEIRGKPVISTSRGLLGIVHGYVIGPGGPGLRVGPGVEEIGYINWLGFLDHVKQVNRRLYEELADSIDPYMNPRIPLSRLEGVRSLIKGDDRVEKLLDKYIVLRQVKPGSHVNIPWSDVISIGDAIITR